MLSTICSSMIASSWTSR